VARYPDDALCAPILEVLGYFLALSPLLYFPVRLSLVPFVNIGGLISPYM
jgi:hypothetical protein